MKGTGKSDGAFYAKLGIRKALPSPGKRQLFNSFYLDQLIQSSGDTVSWVCLPLRIEVLV